MTDSRQPSSTSPGNDAHQMPPAALQEQQLHPDIDVDVVSVSPIDSAGGSGLDGDNNNVNAFGATSAGRPRAMTFAAGMRIEETPGHLERILMSLLTIHRMLNPENCETSTVTAENVAPQPHASFLPLAVLPPLPALKASMSAEDILAIQKLFKELSSMNLFSLYSALLKLDKEMQLKYSQLDAASREVMRDKIERVLRPYQPLIKKATVVTGSERRPSVSSSNAVDVVQPVVPFGSVSGVDLSPVVGGCQEPTAMTGSGRRPSVSNRNAVDVVRPMVSSRSAFSVAHSPVIGSCQKCEITFTNRKDFIGHCCQHFPEMFYSLDWPMLSRVNQTIATSTSGAASSSAFTLADDNTLECVPLVSSAMRGTAGSVMVTVGNQLNPSFHQPIRAYNARTTQAAPAPVNLPIATQQCQMWPEFNQRGGTLMDVSNFQGWRQAFNANVRSNTAAMVPFAAPRPRMLDVMPGERWNANYMNVRQHRKGAHSKMLSIRKQDTRRNARLRESSAAGVLENDFGIPGVNPIVENPGALEPAIAGQPPQSLFAGNGQRPPPNSSLIHRPLPLRQPDDYETCALCSLTFATSDDYFRHMCTDHAGHPTVFSVLMKATGAPPSVDPAVRMDDGCGVKCRLCDERFSELNALEAHVRDAHSHKCFVCPSRFPTSFERNLHMSMHTGYTYDCKDCGLCFPNRQGLASHNRTHRVQNDENERIANTENVDGGNDPSTSLVLPQAMSIDDGHSGLPALSEAAVTANSDEMLAKIEQAIAADRDNNSFAPPSQQPLAEEPTASLSSSPASLLSFNSYYAELLRTTNAGTAPDPLSATYQLQCARRRRQHRTVNSSTPKRLRLRDINTLETKSKAGDFGDVKDKTSSVSIENEENITKVANLNGNNTVDGAKTNESEDLGNQMIEKI